MTGARENIFVNLVQIFFKIITYGTNIFPRTQAETGTECPDYLEYFKVDVRCKDYEEEDP